MTPQGGRKTSTAMRASTRSRTTRAKPKASNWPSGSAAKQGMRATSSTSSRKRATASPGEAEGEGGQQCEERLGGPASGGAVGQGVEQGADEQGRDERQQVGVQDHE